MEQNYLLYNRKAKIKFATRENANNNPKTIEDTLTSSNHVVDISRVSSVDRKVEELMVSVNSGVDSFDGVNILKVVEGVFAVVVCGGSVILMVVLVVASVCCCVVWVT